MPSNLKQDPDTKQRTQMQIEQTPPSISNRLELSKFTAEVQSRIRTQVNSDYILAKLPDKDREAIIEITNNAFFSLRIINNIQRQHEDNGYYLTQTTKMEIRRVLNSLIDIYMTRLTMTALMHRNIDKNYLIDKLSGIATDIEQEEQQEKEEKKLTKVLQKNEKSET